MRTWLSLVLGVLIGQWLAFGSQSSSVELYRLGLSAWERRDYTDAMRVWSHAVSLQPDNAVLHYRRATALAELGQRHAAADGYRLALMLGPPAALARQAEHALAMLEADVVEGTEQESTVPVEPARGVWVTAVTINERPARFLVDTGSSVTLISPALAQTLGLRIEHDQESIELQSLSGITRGSVARAASIRVGSAELRDVPVVVHDPGPGIDGILGNTFLARYRVTVDADRRRLHLRSSSLLP